MSERPTIGQVFACFFALLLFGALIFGIAFGVGHATSAPPSPSTPQMEVIARTPEGGKVSKLEVEGGTLYVVDRYSGVGVTFVPRK